MGLCIYANGEYFDKKEKAVVSIYDHGFLYGDGVFEGIRSYNRRIFRLKQHIDRLYESARSIKLEIPMSHAQMMATHIETVRRTGLADCYIRTVVSRGVGDLGLNPKKCPKPSIFIIADVISLYPEEKYKIGLKLVTVSTRRNRPDTLNARIKSLNYLNNILARIEADLANADEGLMLNDEGYVSEATADNIFMIKGDELATPPPYMGILEGITRAAIIEIAPKVGLKPVEKVMLNHDLYIADEVFVCGTGAELVPVVEIDGRIIGNGKPGQKFWKLLETFRKLTETDGEPVPK